MNRPFISYNISPKYLALLLLCFSTLIAQAQRVNRVNGNIIVQFEGSASNDSKALIVNYQGATLELIPTKEISRTNNIWLIEFDESQLNANALKNAIEATSKVQISQFDFHLDTRSTYPDDPMFASQWAWLDESMNGGQTTGTVAAPEAWDISTGGLTAQGDTIVLALVDDGIDLQHQDLIHNLWKNSAEIPDNGLDDDGNGYIDDVHGWNAIAGLDYVGFGAHGAQVAGVMGAAGDNGQGISGMNWHIAIMPVVAQSMVVSEIIAGYDYVLQQRILWNESNGAQGAFVVGLNTSWGIDNAWAIEAPLWCDFYNTLGEAGIVSCSAVANNDYNIDEFGDLPGTCPSDYQITVTATNEEDVRDFAAYGLQHVDIAAPGANILTTQIGNNYGYATGTSFATPALTGLVGLLYASPCEYLISLAKLDPASAAAYVKNTILQKADTIPSLLSEISSGGRMNAFKTLNHLVNNCETCFAPSQIEVANVDFQSVAVTWEAMDDQPVDLCYKEFSTTEWDTLFNVPNGLILNDLANCTNYQIKLIGNCDTDESATSSIILFETEGCCHAPSTLSYLNSPSNTVLNWESNPNATAYIVEYRQINSLEWIELVSLSPYISLNTLDPCHHYEVRIQTLCGGPYSEYSEIFTFSSGNCDSCSELNYCTSVPESASFEWIESIRLNDQVFTSGTNDGVGDFTDALHFGNLEVGLTNEMTVNFGYSDISYPEFTQAWIDFNQDGIFGEEELITADPANVFDSMTFVFMVPIDAIHGITRMRVHIDFDGGAEVCDDYSFGEVEDYCINIIGTSPGSTEGCFDEITVDTVSVHTTAIELFWSENIEIAEYTVKWSDASLSTPVYDSLIVENTTAMIDHLDACESYQFIVKANCGDGLYNTSETMIFDMDCDVSTNHPIIDTSISIYPNPFQHQLTLESNTPIESYQLIDIHGRLILSQSFPSLPTQVHIDDDELQNLAKGIYWLKIKTNGQIAIQKVIHF